VSEWAEHYWYVIRAVALQAHEELDDNSAAHLVNFMASMAVGMPCPECRDHFVEDWTEAPYTMAHAKSTTKSIQWVEDLRAKVDLRVAAKRRELGLPVGVPVGSGGGAGAAGAGSAGGGHHAGAHHAGAHHAGAHHAGAHHAAAPPAPSLVPSRVTSASRKPSLRGASTALQRYAVTSAMHVTRANQDGRRMGCNCAVHKPTSASTAGRR
jgi:hypothetical protein